MARKAKAQNEELEFGVLLEKAGRQCQREYRLGRASSFGRCQEKHLMASTRPERRGPAMLGMVKVGRTKKMFCQWCTKLLMADMEQVPDYTTEIPVTRAEPQAMDL